MPPQLPIIPQTITVHLGSPSSAAANVTVPFADYIANVYADGVCVHDKVAAHGNQSPMLLQQTKCHSQHDAYHCSKDGYKPTFEQENTRHQLIAGSHVV